MDHFRKWAPGAGTLYILIALAAFLIAIPPVRMWWKISGEDERLRVQAVQWFGMPALEKLVSDFGERLKGGATDDPRDYYITLQMRSFILDLMWKYENMDGKSPEDAEKFLRLQGMLAFPSTRFFKLQEEYNKRFGQKKMAEISINEFPDLGHKQRGQGIANAPSFVPFWRSFWIAYLELAFLAVIFFIVRLGDDGLRVFVEFWRIPLYAIVWPYGIFKYPHSVVNFADQMRSAVRFVGYALSLLLSVPFSAGAVKAETKGGGSKKSGNASGFVLSTEGKLEVEAFTGSVVGNTKGSYFAPEYSLGVETMAGKLSLFGFWELGDVPTFSSNAISYTPLVSTGLDCFSVVTEQGYNGDAFFQIGGKVSLTKLPFTTELVGAVFRYFSIAGFSREVGTGPPYEALVVYGFQKLPLASGFSVTAEGFERIRWSGSISHFGQHGVWIETPIPNIRFGGEVELVDDNASFRPGIKVTVPFN